MPHATEEPTMNGAKPASQFVSHLTSYPVVIDSIETFKANPYGKKSLELADGAYAKFAKPVEPYLETPYSYAKPYLTRADELGDKGLDKVDSTFPIVKEDTGIIVNTAKGYLLWPFKLAHDGKAYVFNTWHDEYEKTAKHKDRGYSISTSVIALVSTEFKIASDLLHTVAVFLGPRYDESKAKGVAYVKKAQETADGYQKLGQEKLNGIKTQVGGFLKEGQQKAAEYEKLVDGQIEKAKTQIEAAKPTSPTATK